MQPGRFTELFFLDEATAFAAGHRPCALCRREDYNRFLSIWRAHHHDQSGADAIDAQLHLERVDATTREHRLHTAPFERLPGGAFVLVNGHPYLVLGDVIERWTPAGYDERLARPGGTATVITPPSLIAVLRSGWSGAVPFLHPSYAKELSPGL
jgi:hypothetical protein